MGLFQHVLPFLGGALITPIILLQVQSLNKKQEGNINILSMMVSHSPTPTITPSPIPTITPSPTLTPTPTTTPTPKPTNTPAPTTTPTPTIPPVTSEQLDTWFTQYSSQYSVDRQRLWNIAVCESGLRTQATNGIYGGMYQFSPSTWYSTRNQMNLDTNPDLRFHAEESIKTAAFLLSSRGHSPWPNCSL